MNVGFRPRLKARPSLYDLIRSRNIEHLSIQRQELVQVEYLPELPTSPGKLPPTSPAPEKEQLQEPVQEPINMAPKKEARDEDSEEQYGMSSGQYELKDLQINDTFIGSIYSVSGYGTRMANPHLQY